LAAQLGSDSPFFIDPQPMLGTGKGEELIPVNVPLKGKFLMLVSPDIHSSTAEAYRRVNAHPAKHTLNDVLKKPIAEWKDNLVNDFETSVFMQYPVLRTIKEKLYQRGARYASMSGSGSTMFGLFDSPQDRGEDFEGMLFWSGELTQ
jgi:4-diphosphocytidyl-2-C-methyl-D-erythritol kinase